MELEFYKVYDYQSEPVNIDSLARTNRIVCFEDCFLVAKDVVTAGNRAKQISKRYKILTPQQASDQHPDLFIRTSKQRAAVSTHLVSVKLSEKQVEFCQRKGNGRVAPYIRTLIDKEIEKEEPT